jgi:hypothetical protein
MDDDSTRPFTQRTRPTARERMRQNIAALRRDDDRDRYLRERFQWDCLAIEAEAMAQQNPDSGTMTDVERPHRCKHGYWSCDLCGTIYSASQDLPRR